MIRGSPARALLVTIGAASALLMSPGCKVGPNYHAPHIETPASFINATTQPTSAPGRSPTTRQSVVEGEHAPWVDWWKSFNDSELNSLVTRALVANHELAVVRARVQEAR